MHLRSQTQISANQLNKLYSWPVIEFIQLVCSSVLCIKESILIMKLECCQDP